MKSKVALRNLLALAACSLLAMSYASAQTTYTWANSNVTGTPTANLDWFTGGPNTQGTWTGGTPVSSNLNTIQFFQDTTTTLPNTANPSTQAVNLNNGGTAFQLGTLTLSGRGSATASANLTMNLSGDALNFSATTGTINLDALNNSRTITYNVANNIQLGTGSSASTLTFTGNGTSAFNFTGNITETFAGSSLIKSGTSTVILSGSNNNYSGTTTLSAGTLQGLVIGTSLNPVSPFGTSTILLNGGTLQLLASGTNNSTAETVNFGNNVTVGADATIYVSRPVGFASSNKTMGLGTLIIGANTLTIDGANVGYSLGFSAVNLTGDAIFSISKTYAPLILGNITQIGGTRSLTKDNVGTLKLIGTNTYTGSTTISAGVLQLGNAGTTGSLTGTSGITNDANLTVNRTDTFTQATDLNNKAIIGSGSFTQAGTGTTTLSGTNSYTGATMITAGTLQASVMANGGNNSSMGASTNAATNLSLANGTTFRYIGSTDVTTDRGFRINGTSAGHGATIESSGAGTLSFNNDIAIDWGTAAQTRTLTLGGTNTGSNTMGKVIANNTSAATSLAKTGIGTWVLSGSNAMTGTTNVSGGGTLVLDFTTNNNAKLGSGILTLSSANITLKGGSYTQAVSSTTFGVSTGNSISRDGGTSQISLGALTAPTGSNLYTLAIAAPGTGPALTTTTNTNATGLTNPTSILALGRVTVGSHFGANSSGDIVEYGDYATATIAGGSFATTVNQLTGGGTMAATLSSYALRIVNGGNSDVLDINSKNLAVSNNSTILYAGGFDNNYTINGTGFLTSSSTDQPLIINTYAGTTLTVNAHIVGRNGNSTGIVKAGEGTLVVGGANDGNISNGICYIQQGVLRLANDTGLGATTAGTVVQGGAALELSQTTDLTPADIAVGAEALTLNGYGISNGGALRNHSGNNSWAGAITIGVGGSRINSNASTSLLLTGGITTTLTQDVTFGGAGNTTVSTTAITGSGRVIKDGNGTLTLSAASTYTGATNINAGKLRITNAAATSATGTGVVTLSGGATTTLSGTGISTGLLTVTSASRIAAGINTTGANGNFGVAGTLSLGTIGGMTLTSANLDFDLANTAITAGGGVNDLILTGGALSLTTTEMFTFYELNGSLITGSAYTLISGASSANTGVNTSGWTTSFLNGSAYTANYSFNGNDLQVTFAAIPEPSAALLGALGLLGLALRRRR